VLVIPDSSSSILKTCPAKDGESTGRGLCIENSPRFLDLPRRFQEQKAEAEANYQRVRAEMTEQTQTSRNLGQELLALKVNTFAGWIF
jgi:hypothetical protein